MNQIKKKILFFFGILLIALSCSKDDSSVPTPTPQEPQNTAPQIENQEFTVAEDIDEITIIGNVVATDADNDTLTYSITTNDNDLFELSPEGALSLVATKEINYDIAQAHTITVSVSDGTTTTSATITINVTNIVNVYVSGWKNFKPKIWKDGEDITPSIMENDNNPIVDIAVQGNDIYAISRSTLYKNNTATKIIPSQNNNSFLSSMQIVGNDIYITGQQTISGKLIPRIWKNGNPINLTNGTPETYSKSVFVKGTDIYAAGFNSKSNNKNIAVVWKNGEMIELTDGVNEARANAVYVANDIVYVVGYESPSAVMWKNNVKINLGTNNFSNGNSIHITEDNDVYIAGYENLPGGRRIPKVWKNTAEIDLAPSDAGEFFWAQDISVFENDVYVVGTTMNPQTNTREATVWKNGEPTYLTSNSSSTSAEVYAVFIK
ncbi:cadherin domain-containing protein [Aquimarina algiphila]|uniref:cadherin domain-containing protein n=1 Tax=Aquimarina algiphila TaxID=2047982 RepID=UPI00232DFCFF|nr:cadherin domain-containing protein [Aquimarina algiphila]